MELEPDAGPFTDPPRMDHKPASSMTIREHVWLTFAAAIASGSSSRGLPGGVPVEDIGLAADWLTAEFEKRFGGGE